MSIIKSLPIICDENTKVLILGTIPGNNALTKKEYYPKNGNKFWKMIFKILGTKEPDDYHNKVSTLLEYKIGLWDILKSADRDDTSSKDSDIALESLQFNDFSTLISGNITHVIFNGRLNVDNGSQKKNLDKINRSIRSFIKSNDFLPNVETLYCLSTSSLNTFKKNSEDDIDEKLEENWKNALIKSGVIH